jgi:hypothetical protein
MHLFQHVPIALHLMGQLGQQNPFHGLRLSVVNALGLALLQVNQAIAYLGSCLMNKKLEVNPAPHIR